MSRFFIGQRVRIVKAIQSTHLVGSETFVTGLDVVGRGHDGKPYIGTATAAQNWCGRSFVARNGYIEPIVPSGLESNAEIDALYEPSQQKVRA